MFMVFFVCLMRAMIGFGYKKYIYTYIYKIYIYIYIYIYWVWTSIGWVQTHITNCRAFMTDFKDVYWKSLYILVQVDSHLSLLLLPDTTPRPERLLADSEEQTPSLQRAALGRAEASGALAGG